MKKRLHNAFDWRNIRLNLMICAGIAILLTFISWQQHQDHLLETLFISLIYSFSIGFSVYFTMIMINFKAKKRILNIVANFLIICLGTIIGVIIANLIFSLFYGTRVLRINFTSLLFLLFAGVFFTLVAISIFYYFHLSEHRKYKYLEEQEKKTKAELRALVSQINPHFLFNTLNSISSLIHLDPDQADEMIQKLSDVFRYSLQSGKKRFVSIKEEINIVEKYLQIEKVRFEERLDYSLDIHPDCLEFSIPPLILQTIVENSVKHGISPKIEGGRVAVSIQPEKEDVRVIISDTGVGLPEDFAMGFGLDAVKNILRLQYDHHSFEISGDDGVRITMSFPKLELSNDV